MPLLPLLLGLLLPSPARATVQDQFGQGPEHIAMAGAVTALAGDTSAAYYNPAGIAQTRHVALSLGYILGQANLMGWDGIVYDTDGDGLVQDADGYVDYGSVGADYRVDDLGKQAPFYTAGLQFGAAFPLYRHITLGIAGYLPSQSLMRIELENPAIPYYVMYRNRNNRFAISPALAFQPWHGVRLGLGVQAMTRIVARMRLSSVVDVDAFTTDTGDGDQVSATVQANVDEMVMSMQPLMAPNFGLQFDMGAFVDPSDPRWDTLRRFAFGVAWRGEWMANTNVDATVTANGSIRFDDDELLLSTLLEEPIHVQITDMVGFYNPAELSIGMRQGYGLVDLTGDLTWVQWSKFTDTVAPYMGFSVDSLAGTTVDIEVGEDLPEPGFKDTWTLRVGGQFHTPNWRFSQDLRDFKFFVRGGYAYIPSPVPDQTGLTNYMDSDRSVFAGGIGLEGRYLKFAKGPLRLDIGGQYHKMSTRTVQKDPSLLTDSTGDGIVDYPQGYPLTGEITCGGNLWVLAAALEMSFMDPKKWPGEKKKPAATTQVPSSVEIQGYGQRATGYGMAANKACFTEARSPKPGARCASLAKPASPPPPPAPTPAG